MTSVIIVTSNDQIKLVHHEFSLLLIITHPANVVGVDNIDLKTKGHQRKESKD